MAFKYLLSLNFFSFLLAFFSPSIPEYIQDWEGKAQPFTLKSDPYGQGSYLSPGFQQYIDKNSVKLILEIGSRDIIDSLSLSEYYKAHVCAFECNPQAIEICQYNLNNNPNVTLVPLAAWNETKSIKFYPIIPSARDFNLGASSLFKMDVNSPDFSPQGEITVEAIRLDDWLNFMNYQTPDLICIDAQGATLQILQGLGERLSQVKYIIAEIEFVRFYEGEALHPEVVSFLKQNGFEEVMNNFSNGYFADSLFIRKD